MHSPGPSSEPSREPSPAPPRRAAGRWWIRPAISLLLYTVIFGYWVDVDALARILRSSNLVYVGGAVLIYCAGQLTSAYRWRLLLGPVGLIASYGRLVAMYFMGMFFSIFLPTIVGGDAIKALMLSRETGSAARATISVFMDRNAGLFALLTIATLAAGFVPPEAGFGASLWLIAGGLWIVYVAANLVLIDRRSYGLLDRLVARTPVAALLRHRASSLYEAVAPYARHPGTLGAAVGLSFIHQTVVIGVVFLNACALGQSFPLSALAVFVPLVSLAGMLPLSVNGMGVREAAYVVLFGQLGTSPELSVSLAFLYLAVTFIASLPGGIVYAVQKVPLWPTE